MRERFGLRNVNLRAEGGFPFTALRQARCRRQQADDLVRCGIVLEAG
jgi:hypothetical protein